MAVSYTVFIEPEVHAARDQLPGHMRQRMRRAIDELVRVPRPSGTRPLDAARLDLPLEVELRRLRVEAWRLIYAVNDIERWVWILGIQRRPPYNYDDLSALAAKLRS